MSARIQRRIRALGSLSRKQHGDVEEARVANSRIREELERAEELVRAMASRIDGVERELRGMMGSARPLLIDEMRRWSGHLMRLREQLQERRIERDAVAVRAAAAEAQLARCIQSREATERVTERVKRVLAGELRRQAYRQVDEQWLLRRDEVAL